MPARRRSLPLLLPVLVAATLFLAGCGGQQQPNEYGDAYEENFTFGCEQQAASEAGPQAPKDYCKCVYDGLVDKVPFEDAKKFEEQQAEADEGEIEVPKNIQAVFDSCNKAS